MPKKFSLVKFVDDDILYVAPTKKIKVISNDLVKAPYKNMGCYNAVLIRDHDEKLVLENLKKEMIESAEGDDEAENDSTGGVNTEMLYQKSNIDEGTDRKFQDEHTNKIISENESDVTGESLEVENEDQAASGLNETGHEHKRHDFSSNKKYALYDHEDDDDSIADPDFDPRSMSDSPYNENFQMDVENISRVDIRGYTPLPESENSTTSGVDSSATILTNRVNEEGPASAESSPTMDFRRLHVIKSTSNVKSKQHFCKFCKRLQTKFARHLENKHSTEKEVQEFMQLPKKDTLRLKLIEKIRNGGDFLYNTKEEFNPEKNLIVVRCPKPGRRACDFRPCGVCGGMYSKASLYYHFKNCRKNKMRNAREAVLMSKRKSVHSCSASKTLRKRILPHLREDEISTIIRTDETVILFGNRLCQKYRSQHLDKMIRAKLRCVATFVKTFWDLKGEKMPLKNIIDPTYYNDCISSINQMCGFDEITGRFRSPGTAFSIGSHLKKISFYLVTEYIKKKDKQCQEDTKDFLLLLQEGLSHDINKTVHENELENKRKKKVIIPTSSDIQKLRSYLDEKRNIHIREISEEFRMETWKDLLGVVLISLQLFNRRRAGEVERIEVDDFMSYEKLNEDDEMINGLPELEKRKLKQYVRFLIRGKLSRGVPVMVSKDNLKAIKLLLNYRSQAGVNKNNKYLFGTPGDKNSHLSATILMRKFSNLCGADNPHTLRGTELRKHIATKCATMDLGPVELKDVADYLGHHEKIHLEHYRLPNVTKDIVRMSNILEKAQGGQNSWRPTDEDAIETFNESFGLGLPGPSSANISVESVKNESGYKGRISWGRNEKEVVEKKFEYYINTCEMPTVAECNQFLMENGRLRRSTGQLRGYISNQIKKRREELTGCPSTSTKTKLKRNRWSPEEKEVVHKAFEAELRQKTLPSIIRCKEVIEENHILKKRTCEQLKAFLNNTNKKSK